MIDLNALMINNIIGRITNRVINLNRRADTAVNMMQMSINTMINKQAVTVKIIQMILLKVITIENQDHDQDQETMQGRSNHILTKEEIHIRKVDIHHKKMS